MSIRIPGTAGRILLLIVLLFSSLASGAFAQESVGPNTVEITASRIQEPTSVAPQAVTVVDSAEIAARGATTVAEAVALAPGVEITDKGASGSQLSATIRGSTSNQVLVLVDGVRANDPLTGLADLSRLPLDNVERIEIVRGGSSSLYGGDAVGGVINIITKKTPRPFTFSIENGSYVPQGRVTGFGFSKASEGPAISDLVDSQKLAFSWGPRLGPVLFQLAGGAQRAGNAYTYIDANGDGRERQNAGLLSGDLSLGSSVDLPDARLSIDASGAYSRKGVPGSESLPSLTAIENDGSARAALSYKAERFLADAFTLDATAHAEYASVDYVDSAAPANDGHHKSITAGVELSQKAYVEDSFTLVYGSSMSWTGASSNDLGTPTRLTGGAFVEPALTTGKLILRPSLRYDYYSDFSPASPLGGIGAGLGASYALSDGESLKANLTRTYRVPCFDDLYWPASDGAQGNPSLKPETAYEIDIGYERTNGAWHFSGTLYSRYAQDVILWEPGSDGIWRPSNYGIAFYPGAELALGARLGGGLEITTNYSYLRSYALDGGLSFADDKRLPFTPEHSLKASLSGTFGEATWSLSETYVSSRYLNTANVSADPSYFVLDAILRTNIGAGISLYLAADNLLDEPYSVVDGYPMPGTKFRTGFEFKP
ncbi:MAG TPA: TonB-dependent receptor [Rectinemataceae bacterium]|nr:TonB-dependent receptor [Rectinemataceae bacterium]